MKQQFNNIRIIFCCYIITGLLYIVPNPVLAANMDSVKYDNSHINVRQPPDEKIEELKNNPVYKYDIIPQNPETLWQRIKRWMWQQFIKLFSNEGAAPFIRYAIFILLLVLLITRLLNARLQNLFYRNKFQEKINIKEISEDIHKLDLDSLIRDEIENKNYKNAIRLLYLKLLKLLSDSGLILWTINKTNTDYMKEIVRTPYNVAFGKLSALYEFIWYGDFNIEKEGFDKVRVEFDSIYDKIYAKQK